MFLSKYGSSDRFKFDEICLTLYKGLLRGDVKISLEMAKEFKYYPNMLMKKLIEFCCINCPNIYLINDIYNVKCYSKNNTDIIFSNLICYVPAICIHDKYNEATLAFRTVCEKPYNYEELTIHDNELLTISSKCFTILCKHDSDATIILDFFEYLIPNINIKRIYNFISKKICFIWMLCAWKCINNVTQKQYIKPQLYEVCPNFNMNEYIINELPDYSDDVHIQHSMNENVKLNIEDKQLFMKSNELSSFECFIKPILKCKKLDDNIKLIQIYSSSNSNVDIYMNCSNKHMLEGPYESIKSLRKTLLSDYIKKNLNLFHMNYKIVEYKCKYYLIWTNVKISNEIFDETSNETSKVVSEETFDEHKFLNHFEHEKIETMKSKQIVELFKILVFRKAIGTKNTNVNDILYYNKTFVSVNDSMSLKETKCIFEKSLDEKLCHKYKLSLKKNFKKIVSFINQFMIFIYNDKIINTNYKTFMLNQLSKIMKPLNWKFKNF